MPQDIAGVIKIGLGADFGGWFGLSTPAVQVVETCYPLKIYLRLQDC